ncbi:hypothetical protein CPB84DRAFT_258642 [Gymnopilus junonius]|uniref:Uncharacterized protein n=1 Tax=Gymnopilus junonius TaxID=109634 RepID=A0A9P5NDT1_GYMJU|nr:hypothetical protein CPB84DRAFT_258642 [Gymnopilus junonius]
MYAYPASPHPSSFSLQSTRNVPASPLLNNFTDVSMTISHSSRSSSESRSQYSVDSARTLPSTGSHPVVGMFDSSLDATSQQTSQTINIINSTRIVNDYSAASPPSSASHGSESLASSSNISQGSTSSSSSTSTLRVVGRGGSGSRLRLVTPTPENLDPARLRQDSLPVIRPIGRGGLGSRPKHLEVSSLPSRDALQTEQAGRDKPLVRPIGRGGLGSRQKPLKSPPALPTIWSKRSVKPLKVKGKARERRAIHPITPNSSWRISGGSLSTISTIHFAGESDHPAYVSPFSPTNSVSSAYPNPNPNPRARSLSDPSLSSFTFPASQTTSSTTVAAVGEADEDSDINDDEVLDPKNVDHRQKSLNKLTRTLGDMPPDVFDALNGGRPLQGDYPSKLPLDSPVAKRDKSAKVTRRSSLSVASLSSLFTRPSSRRRDSVASEHSMSTITDDLPRFRMEDDFSEQWGSRSDSRAESGFSRSPDSPIMFAPPSPAYGPALKSPESPELQTPVEPEQEDDTPYVPSPTLSRSLSYTPLSRRSAIASHNHSASASLLTARSDSPALNSNWMIPPSTDDEEVVFTLTHHVPEKPPVWTGEWNGDLQHVIKSLRTLR